ncbi:MAG TPA: hypothetical protein VF844_11410 [Ktedonobacteraceae bacterium]
MQVLPVLVAALLGMFALAFVLYPLYRRTPLKTSQVASLSTSASSQVEREQRARAALQEVELDYQLGNLAEVDYRSLRTRYLRRAALAMKARQEREQELDETIEEQLRRMKEKAGDANE